MKSNIKVYQTLGIHRTPSSPNPQIHKEPRSHDLPSWLTAINASHNFGHIMPF